MVIMLRKENDFELVKIISCGCGFKEEGKYEETLDLKTEILISNSACISPTQHSKSTHKKRVSFNQIHIREYSLEMGDNPSCSRGPPLSISWDYNDVGSIDLQEFEETRPARRYHGELIIPLSVRKEILLSSGYSPLQITNLVETVNNCKLQRAKSARFDDILLRANRKLTRRFKLG